MRRHSYNDYQPDYWERESYKSYKRHDEEKSMKNCGHCRYCIKTEEDYWTCNNIYSSHYGFITEYIDSCEEFEIRDKYKSDKFSVEIINKGTKVRNRGEA